MATGFSLNETARLQIRTERGLMRHLGNSLVTAQPIPADKAASFTQHRKADRDR
jgi:hypothetical protein